MKQLINIYCKSLCLLILSLSFITLISCSGVASSINPVESGNNNNSPTQVTLSSLSINPNPIEVPLDIPVQFSAIASYSDGSQQDVTESANWSSENENIAQLSESTTGLVNTIGIGVTTITATYSGQSAASQLTITDAVLNSITITPESSNVALGSYQKFTAIGNYTSGPQDLTAVVKWTSESPSTATINESGIADGINLGQTEIIASYNGIISSATINVTPVTTLNSWVSGSKNEGQPSSYGIQGESSPNNNPGARTYMVSWTDKSGQFWLFGGIGYTTRKNSGSLNDLWKYNPKDNTWTWVSGTNTLNATGIYGTKGVESVANMPGARSFSNGWVDASGNLWLFGGTDANLAQFNDLWKYNPKNNTWTWVSGDNGPSNASGKYGEKGTPSIDNIPGTREEALSWTDHAGNLWLFGGYGHDAAGKVGNLNDLWEYSIKDNSWTWVNGNNAVNTPGIYGTKGSASANNIPGSRHSAVGVVDQLGNFWLFGGYGKSATQTGGFLNDLWKFNPTDKTWTWVSGSNTINSNGVYGSRGIPSIYNVPGARNASDIWLDNWGNLWVFGGNGIAETGINSDLLNDLWRYSITHKTWTWVGGSKDLDGTGSYGVDPASDNIPSARSDLGVWVDTSGNLWLFGGYTYNHDYINDMWKIQLK